MRNNFRTATNMVEPSSILRPSLQQRGRSPGKVDKELVGVVEKFYVHLEETFTEKLRSFNSDL